MAHFEPVWGMKQNNSLDVNEKSNSSQSVFSDSLSECLNDPSPVRSKDYFIQLNKVVDFIASRDQRRKERRALKRELLMKKECSSYIDVPCDSPSPSQQEDIVELPVIEEEEIEEVILNEDENVSPIQTNILKRRASFEESEESIPKKVCSLEATPENKMSPSSANNEFQEEEFSPPNNNDQPFVLEYDGEPVQRQSSLETVESGVEQDLMEEAFPNEESQIIDEHSPSPVQSVPTSPADEHIYASPPPCTTENYSPVNIVPELSAEPIVSPNTPEENFASDAHSSPEIVSVQQPPSTSSIKSNASSPILSASPVQIVETPQNEQQYSPSMNSVAPRQTTTPSRLSPFSVIIKSAGDSTSPAAAKQVCIFLIFVYSYRNNYIDNINN